MKIYSLAYHLNRFCFTNFSRSKKDLLVNNLGLIPHFKWVNEKKGIDFELFPNKYKIENYDNEPNYSLFSISDSKELYLMNSLKQVDYLIKQNCFFSTTNLINKMSTIPAISISYKIPEKNIDENFNLDL